MTVIILSKTASNLIPCLEAVRKHEPHAQIVVVDDGLSSAEQIAVYYLQARIVPGDKPFVFARNVNIGIAACDDDVVLLNDDALLETPNGFSMLAKVAEDPTVGIVAPTTNVTGLREQWRRGDHSIRFMPRVIPFVCVYIPRRVIDQIGLLDERYVGYGWEDNDYCRRVTMASLKLAIVDDVYVDHGSLVSTFRGDPKAPGDLGIGRKLFTEKWGVAQ
jgi:GT2 family glycosyltransferase